MVSEIPRGDRCWVTPQADFTGASIQFGLRISTAISRQLFFLILFVVPGQACLNQTQIGIQAIDDHFADRSTVSVRLAPIHGDLLSKDQVAELLLGPLAESLSLFRRVNAGQTYLVLRFVAVEHGNRIAIADADDGAL